MPSRLPTPNPSFLSQSISGARSQCRSQQARNFSQSSQRDQTQLRRKMFEWLNGPGAPLRQPLLGRTNYLGAYDKAGVLKRESRTERRKDAEASEEEGLDAEEQTELDPDKPIPESKDELEPFRLNRTFRSQPVLSEELREKIFSEVTTYNQSLEIVSSRYGVTMERVAAVVRLKTIEKQWEQEGKRLAKPYSKAILNMVPTTKLRPTGKQSPHESIQDLPVHPATRQQIFYPTSESRHFTRVDAAKVFDNDLLPADKRIPHPDIVEAERDNIRGLSFEQRVERQQERNEKRAQAEARAEQKRAEHAAKTKTVTGRRWDFKFQDVSVEQVGRDGKSPAGVGWRYGAPHEDRKRGQVKIPKRVEA